MSDTPAKMSRRRLLISGGLAVAGAVLARTAVEGASRGQSVEVLVHDEVHDGAAFARGRLLGARLRAGLIEGNGLFESEVIGSPFPFTHAGLHWRGGPSSEVRLEARTSADGVAWTSWRALAIEARPEETPSQETYAFLLGAARQQFLQYRAFLASQGQLASVTATFLNSADGPRTEQVSLALAANSVIDRSRADWGCDESLRLRGKREIWPRMYVPVKKLVVHHTATERVLLTDAEVEQEVRAIYTYHARTLGWGDIGYGALIGLNGKSYEGRHGRGSGDEREVFSHDVVAGHAYEHNYGTNGVALIGYFHPPYNMYPNAAMLSRLLDVFEQVGLQWEIDPEASSKFLQSNGAWNNGPSGTGLINLCGHRDCSATACPGDVIYAQLSGDNGLRRQLKQRLETGAPLLEAPAPLLSGPDGVSTTGNSLSFLWQGGNGSELAYYLEGWFKSSRSEAVTYLRGFDASSRPIWEPWTAGSTSKSFAGLPDGHYTFHLRSRDSEGNISYQANKTVHII